jgi:uncharacterized protein involved in oxidation of intracellular sulfur
VSILIVFNRSPCDGCDVTCNGLRLADTWRQASDQVRLLLMNDAVDLARDACRPPAGYDQDLGQMRKGLLAGRLTGGVNLCHHGPDHECPHASA